MGSERVAVQKAGREAADVPIQRIRCAGPSDGFMQGDPGFICAAACRSARSTLTSSPSSAKRRRAGRPLRNGLYVILNEVKELFDPMFSRNSPRREILRCAQNDFRSGLRGG